jgi:hypothetical protein
VVAAALENSADPVAAQSGALEPVVRQGSGLVDIDDAIQATTRITPGTLSLGEDAHATRTVTIENRSRSTVTYALSSAGAPAIAGRDILFAQLQPNPSTVTFTLGGRPVSSLTLPARGAARVGIDITPDPGLSEGAVYGGYLVFTPGDDNDPALRVPYAGYKGDYQSVPVLTPTTQGFPWLARQTGLSTTGLVLPVYTKQDAGAVFSMAPVTFGSRTGADIPIVLLHLNNFARRIRVEVVRPGRRQSLGMALTQDYVPRNQVENLLSTPGGLTTAVPFDGTVRHGRQHVRLADGDYQLVVSAEGPLAGRRDVPETWTSPVFTIRRAVRTR